MCIMAIRQRTSNDRYKRYAQEKSKIPINLPPKEYERRVKNLAKKFKI